MFIKGKKKRQELRLPILHYIVADDWIDKLGEKAFVGWLRFNTWCDRTDEAREKSDFDIVPYSLERVAERLGCSVSTLYRTYIHPLWEYGLIDLQEYEESKRKTTKPVNIIVYEYPQNDKELETKPLEKCRDWKNDYGSQAQIFALKLHIDNPSKNERVHPSKNERVHPSKNERVHPSKNERVTLSKIEGNNVLNISNNVSNISITNDSNTLIMDEERNPQKNRLFQYLLDKKVDKLVANKIAEIAIKNKMNMFKYEIDDQLKQMYFEMEVEGKQIYDFPAYFIGGIDKKREQRTMKQNKMILEMEQKRREAQRKPKVENPTKPVPFYNWLEK